MINSLKTYEILKTGELTDAQAHAITEAIGIGLDDNNLQQAKTVATQEHLGKIGGSIAQMETSLMQEMGRMESSLRSEIAGVESSLRLEITGVGSSLRSEIAGIESSLNLKIAGVESSLRSEIAGIESSLNLKIAGVESSLRSEIARVESSLHLEIAKLETKVADTKSEVLRWMFIFWVGQVAATVAIVFSAMRLLK